MLFIELHNLSQSVSGSVGCVPWWLLLYKSEIEIIPHIQMSASIFGHTRTNDDFASVTSHLEFPNICPVLLSVLGRLYQTELRYWVLYFTLLRVSSVPLVCKNCIFKKKKARVWWNGKETDYRKTATARQTNCPASLCESFWGNNSDGWEDERPVSWGHMLISLFSAISLFANHYPWHTLLFYPSIKMREGREREMDASGDLQ